MNQEMRDLLARASLLSEVAAHRLDPTKGHSTKPGGNAPPGRAGSLHGTMLLRFQGARTPLEASRAVHWGREALENALRAPAPPRELLALEMMRGTIHWKRRLANSDEKVSELARKNMVSRKTIYLYRERYRDEKVA